ncbi:MAG: prepilin peptidase [Elusimicrobia bacterium]|nr:prepilin peptidase [Elusimicrobiota bacterium]
MTYAFLIIFVSGLVLGSFSNVCIWRIPRDISIVKPGSFCPSCRKGILWYCNIPVLSFVFLKGRCSSCGCSIGLRYPLIEILTALLTLSWFVRFGVGVRAGTLAVMGVYLVIISAIDAEHQIIPEVLSLSLMLLGIVSSPLNPLFEGPPLSDLAGSISGLALGGLLVLLLRWAGALAFKKEAMGIGDVKLMMALGAYTGMMGVFWTLFLGSIAGSIAGITFKMVNKKKELGYIPFGPFLGLGAVIYALFSAFFGKLLSI